MGWTILCSVESAVKLSKHGGVSICLPLTLELPKFPPTFSDMHETVALAQHNGKRVLRAAHGNPYH